MSGSRVVAEQGGTNRCPFFRFTGMGGYLHWILRLWPGLSDGSCTLSGKPYCQLLEPFINGYFRYIAEVAAGGGDIEPVGGGKLPGDNAGQGRFARQPQEIPENFAPAACGGSLVVAE
jgi:hypothetical protein